MGENVGGMDMKRLFACLLVMACLLGCLAGCSGRRKYTFTDDLGRKVTVRQPDQVAALLGSFAEVWQLAGGKLKAASNDAFTDFKLSLDIHTVNLGSTKQLSLELLLQIKPDFVIASANSEQHLQWRERLEQEKIPVAYFDVMCFEDYLRMLKICTDITGCTDRYETYGTSQQAVIDAARGRRPDTQKGPKVLVIRASSKAVRAKDSGSTVLGVILQELGYTNVADTPGTFADVDHVTMDEIVALDPDFIFAIPSGDDEIGMQQYLNDHFGEDPRWTELSAVKNGRAHVVDKKLFQFKPNAKWAEAYQAVVDYLFVK